MEEYGALFARLEALKGEMERAVRQGGSENAEFLRLRRQLLSLELEITDLRLRDLTATPVQPAPRPVPEPRPVPTEPAQRPRYTYNFSPPPQSPPRPARPVRTPGRSALGLSESGVGKYILSLLASLLILLGCCVLILMGWNYMTALVKAAVIALGGALFVGAGLLLSKRLPRPFSDSLVACGLGILYADVVALYQAWALVPLWAVLLLILAWDAACILLGKRGRTRLFFYVLCLGNFVTAALACQLISDSPLSVISLLFVGATQAGAVLAFRRLYGKFDPVLALTAGATAIYLNLTHFAYIHHFFSGYAFAPGGWIILCLILCAALSGLVLWTAGWTLELKSAAGGRAAYLCLTIPVLLTMALPADALGHYAAAWAGLPALERHLPLLLVTAGAAGLLGKTRFRREGYCIFAPVLLFAAEGVGSYYGFDALGAGLAALGTVAVYARKKTRVTETVCAAAYGVCLCLLWSLWRPAAYFPAAAAALAVPLALMYQWRSCGSKRQSWGILLCGYAGALVLLRGVAMQGMDRMFSLMLLALLGVLLAALPIWLKAPYRRYGALALHERIQGFAFDGVLLAYTWTLAWAGPAERAVAVALLFLQGVNLLYAAYFRWETGGQFGWGLAAAGALTLNLIQSARLTPAGAWPIFLSLLCIALAACYIILGFFRKSKPLRIFGLVLAIGSVLKMVTIDVVGSPSFFRVAALMAGGLLCFGISFVYNWVEQRQNKKE